MKIFLKRVLFKISWIRNLYKLYSDKKQARKKALFIANVSDVFRERYEQFLCFASELNDESLKRTNGETALIEFNYPEIQRSVFITSIIKTAKGNGIRLELSDIVSIRDTLVQNGFYGLSTNDGE